MCRFIVNIRISLSEDLNKFGLIFSNEVSLKSTFTEILLVIVSPLVLLVVITILYSPVSE